jgi:hypothetical protein
MRARVLADRGFTESDVPATLSEIIDTFIEAVLFRQTYWTFLVQSGGVITTKGRQRRAFDGWLRACDRVEKLARLIGLTRQAKDSVMLSPAAWLEREVGGVDAEE